MDEFLQCFVPLFVAVNPLGVLPMFIGLTEGLETEAVRRAVLQSVITAMVVALAFLAAGKFIIDLVGVTVPDFMIAGGTLLFVISLRNLITVQKSPGVLDPHTLGAVPVGVPLITGPALMTTTLLLLEQHGALPTTAATVLNIGIAGVVFWFSRAITRVLGTAGARTLSKLASLLLAAIAVMIVRKGLVAHLAGG